MFTTSGYDKWVTFEHVCDRIPILAWLISPPDLWLISSIFLNLLCRWTSLKILFDTIDGKVKALCNGLYQRLLLRWHFCSIRSTRKGIALHTGRNEKDYKQWFSIFGDCRMIIIWHLNVVNLVWLCNKKHVFFQKRFILCLRHTNICTKASFSPVSFVKLRTILLISIPWLRSIQK